MDDDDTGTETTTETTTTETERRLVISMWLPDADAALVWAAKISLALMTLGLGFRIAWDFATTGGS